MGQNRRDTGSGSSSADTTTIATTAATNNDHQVERRYKGVRKRKWGKWVSEIRLPNSRERIWLGSYDSPEKAARAFDAATFYLRGCKAASRFNFPHSIPDIRRLHHEDGRMNAAEIQLAASKFANSEREENPTPPADYSSTTTDQRESALDWSFLQDSVNTSASSTFPMDDDLLCDHQLSLPAAFGEEQQYYYHCSHSSLWDF